LVFAFLGTQVSHKRAVEGKYGGAVAKRPVMIADAKIGFSSRNGSEADGSHLLTDFI